MAEENKNHVKPTQEELKAQEQAAIEEAEKLENNPPEEKEEEVEDVPSKVDKAKDNEVEQGEEDKEEVIPEDKREAEPSKELYKKKFSASSRENQRIAAKNRVINKALADAEDVPEPTEEELQDEFNDWDIMSDVEKKLAKETVISRNWRKVISQAKEQATKIEKWNESVNEFIEDPKTLIANPALEGKADEFKEYATVEANNSVPFNILVSAFLHDNSINKTNNKGRMFERGSGGPNDKPQPKSDKISLEEARKIRETDYNKWKELNAQGKIDYNL